MIHDAVLPQLRTLALRVEHPLLIVDVDEVLVGLAAHLGEFAAARGYRLELTGYKLDGALKRANGTTASEDEFRSLFKRFFEAETIRQRVYPDAASVLRRMSDHAQIVILTNVPPAARASRIRNLRGHGIEYPLIVNRGPKGEAVAWMEQRVAAPVAFIDDSPSQIASVAERAPDVTRIQFVGDGSLRAMLEPFRHADHAPANWLEIESIVAALFGGGAR